MVGNKRILRRDILRKTEEYIARGGQIKKLRSGESAERAEAPLTAAAIVHATIGQGVEEQDRLRVWTEDANSLIARDS